MKDNEDWDDYSPGIFIVNLKTGKCTHELREIFTHNSITFTYYLN